MFYIISKYQKLYQNNDVGLKKGVTSIFALCLANSKDGSGDVQRLRSKRKGFDVDSTTCIIMLSSDQRAKNKFQSLQVYTQC